MNPNGLAEEPEPRSSVDVPVVSVFAGEAFAWPGATPDALDAQLLDQLAATLVAANSHTFEMKKLCATVLVPFAALVFSFTRDLSPAIFASSLTLILVFWVCDSYFYFEQRNIRGTMNAIWLRRSRRSEGWLAPTSGRVKWWRAAFNRSMLFYAVAAGAVAFGWLLAHFELISIHVL